MSKFQLALLIIFGFFIVIAVVIFSFYQGSSSSSMMVKVWGSIPTSEFNLFLNNRQLNQVDKISYAYTEKTPETLETEFTEALARGEGPDLIILSQEDFWSAREKLTLLPYSSVSERDFKNAFAEGSEIFLSPEGVYALPIAIDPLVLYYNRDALSTAGIAQPLAFWDEIYTSATKLTKRDGAGNLAQSTIALGEARNIPLYKEILSLLFIQAGTPITGFVGEDLRSLLSINPGLPILPADSALDFYTQFANPTRAYYSWNRTLPEAQTHFTSGEAAYYLGFVSELPAIRRKSPTLNFSVAKVPQSRVSGRSVTFGRIYGVALSRGVKNPTGALEAALMLVARENALELDNILGLPPARRDLLSLKPTDTLGSVIYDSALQARAFVDPAPIETAKLFQDAIESVTSGRARTSEAVSALNRGLEAVIKE